jgi:hypothetical protein
MKRLALTLVAGAFGSLMVLPVAHAWSWSDWDINNDADSIRQDNVDIQHDRDEQREMIENGRLGAAAREQAEINARREHRQALQDDLNNDMANRYYGDEGSYGRGYNYRGYNDDDDND